MTSTLRCSLGLFVVLSLCLPHVQAAHLDLGPMLGHVGSNDARIWVKASEASRLGVWIGQEADLADAKRVEGPMLDKTEDCNGHIRVDGLKPSTRYYYAMLLGGKLSLIHI